MQHRFRFFCFLVSAEVQIFSKTCTEHDSSMSEWWLIFSSHPIRHKLLQLFKFDHMSRDNDRGVKRSISKEHRNEVLRVGQLHERSIRQTPVSVAEGGEGSCFWGQKLQNRRSRSSRRICDSGPETDDRRHRASFGTSVHHCVVTGQETLPS